MNVTTYVTTRKVGGSIVITLPKQVVDLVDIHEHETIKIGVEKPRKTYVGSLKGIGKFTHDERKDHRD